MIITGIIICVAALVLSIVNFGVMFARDDMGGGNLVFHLLCMIGWVAGLAVIAIGVVDKLGWA